MKHDIPADPNPFITAWLKGDECKALMAAKGAQALELYRALVAKRTGFLAASASVEVRLGGLTRPDRYVAVMRANAPYAASVEFGAGNHPRSTGRHHNAAAHTLNEVLGLMAR